MDCGGMEAPAGAHVRNKVTQNLHACGAAVRARIMRPFQGTARMQDHGTDMTHYVGIGLREQLDVMAGGDEPVHECISKPRFHA